MAGDAPCSVFNRQQRDMWVQQGARCSAAMGSTAVTHQATTADLKRKFSAPHHNMAEQVCAIPCCMYPLQWCARQHCMFAQLLTAALSHRSMH